MIRHVEGFIRPRAPPGRAASYRSTENKHTKTSPGSHPPPIQTTAIFSLHMFDCEDKPRFPPPTIYTSGACSQAPLTLLPHRLLASLERRPVCAATISAVIEERRAAVAHLCWGAPFHGAAARWAVIYVERGVVMVMTEPRRRNSWRARVRRASSARARARAHAHADARAQLFEHAILS
jgi:hypothetical protein